MSRHLQDLYKMLTPVANDPLRDYALYGQLIQHREWESRISWVNYDSLQNSAVSFLAPGVLGELYRADYETMREQIIYEDVVPFDTLITWLKYLQELFRLKLTYADLDWSQCVSSNYGL
jgi:hypothetical protein